MSNTGFALVIFLAVGLLAATTAQAELLTDPMRPYSAPIQIEKRTGNKSFVLSAILYSTDRRVAIVNGKPVSEGQRISGATVRLIERGRVELDVNGEILRLALASKRQTK